MASSVQYIFTTMTINLTRLEESVDSYRETILKTIKQVQSIPDTIRGSKHIQDLKERLINNLYIHLDDLDTEKVRIKNIKGHLPKQEEHPKVGGKKKHQRSPRFVIQMLFGALGTFMGMFDKHHYAKMQKQIEEQHAITKRLIEVVNTQGKAINDILSSLDQFQSQLDAQAALNPANLDAALQSTNRKVRLEVSQVFRVLQTAQWRRLSMDFLSEEQSNELYDTLEATALESGSTLLIQKPSDIFQLELSYFYNGDIITLLLHVPMVPKGSLLRLVKLHPFPLPVAGNYSIVPDVDSEILALSVTEVRMSAQFPATNLMGCNQINHIYLCENQGVLNKKLSQSCLGALYNQDFVTARTLCPMKIIYAEEVIYRLQDNVHLVYTPVGQTIPINCPDKSYEKWIQKGVSEFQLEAGCKAELIHHWVFADYAISLDTGLQHIILPRESEMGLPNVKPEELEQLLIKMNKNGLYRPTVNDIIEAYGEQSVISNIKSDIATLQEGGNKIQSQFQIDLQALTRLTLDIQKLREEQETAMHKIQEEQSSIKAKNNYTVSQDLIFSEFAELEQGKTSFTWSIVAWSIFLIAIIALIIAFIILSTHFRYQIKTLYKAFNANNRKALRRLITDFFTQYKLNILSNQTTSIPPITNPA